MPNARILVLEAAQHLAGADVPSPEYDAAELLAHVLGTTRGLLATVGEVDEAQRSRYDELVARRVAREPLQHLLGVAWFRHVSVEVGPGVFVPRPETELLAGWAIDRARSVLEEGRVPIVVDLCTGSGVIAKSIADEAPQAKVFAVELDPPAHAWAERNLSGTDVELRLGDLATAFDDLVGQVDVVVSNPPYVPLEAWESVAAEARDHDPHLALFSGDDGLDAIRVLARRGLKLLRSGGVIGVEHADVQGVSAPAVFSQDGRWDEVRDHRDLSGRARYLTARRPRSGATTVRGWGA